MPFGGVLFADPAKSLRTNQKLRLARHQCLSAECCSRTKEAFEFASNGEDAMSPVPFGGVLFADMVSALLTMGGSEKGHQCLSAECCSRTRLASRSTKRTVSGHQCLSAECCSRTRTMEEADLVVFTSPVPFGGVLFADKDTPF